MSDVQPGRTAVVTGATSGIGEAIVVALCRLGIEVFAVGRNRAALEAIALASGARSIVADVRDAASIVSQLAGAEIDILVNNAGVLSSRANLQDIDPAEIDAMIDINLKAPMHLTRALLPGMTARRRGHLIFIGSMGGMAPFPSMGVYGPSKAGLSLFCDNLRCDLLGTSVRVSEVTPGRVQTQLYKTTLGMEAAQAELYDGYRPIQPEHIATIVSQIIALPDYVDVARVEVYPTDQALGGGSMVKHKA